LYVAFELGQKDWKLAMTSGFGVAPWLRSMARGDWRGVERAMAQGRARVGMPAGARVVSCYEAGRDGFWIHRALRQRGISNRVVDSASIEVNRRARRAKTDRLDALKLVMMLVRVCWGERRVWSEVHVPSVADEAARQVSRERAALTQEQTRLINQLRGGWRRGGAPSHRAGEPAGGRPCGTGRARHCPSRCKRGSLGPRRAWRRSRDRSRSSTASNVPP
jgi:transposase